MAPRTAQTAASSRPRRGVNPVAAIDQTAAFSRPKRTIRQPNRYTPEAPTRVKKRATVVSEGQQKRRARKTRADRGSTRARKSALPTPAPDAQQDRDGDVDVDGVQEEDVEMNTPTSPVPDQDTSMHDRNDDDDDAPGAAQQQQPNADWTLDDLDNEDGAGETHQAPEERSTPKEDRMEDKELPGGQSEVGQQDLKTIDLTGESDGHESDQPKHQDEEEDEPQEEADLDEEDMAEKIEFARQLGQFHNDTMYDTDENLALADVFLLYKLRMVHKEVLAISTTDLFTEQDWWLAIADNVGLDYAEDDRQNFANELKDVYVTVVTPVFPAPERTQFLDLMQTKLGKIFHSNRRYTKNVVISSRWLGRDVQVCPYWLSKLIEEWGGYDRIETDQCWESVAQQLGIAEHRLTFTASRLRLATSELLEPLRKNDEEGMAAVLSFLEGEEQARLIAQEAKASKKINLMRPDDIGVDVEVFRQVLLSQSDTFNHTTDIQKWEDIADSLSIRKGRNRNTMLKRHWRWSIQPSENEAAEKSLVAVDPPRTLAWKQSAFYDAYKHDHGKEPQAVMIAKIIEDLGGKEKIDAPTKGEYNWLYVVKEVWFNGQGMTKYDWQEIAENLEMAARSIVGMVNALKEKELSQAEAQSSPSSPNNKAKTQKRKASSDANGDEQPPQKEVCADNEPSLMPPPTSMPPPRTPGSGSNRPKARPTQSRMSAPSLPTETGYSVPGATPARSARLVGNSTSTPAAAPHGYDSPIEEVQRIAPVAPMSSSPSAIGLSPSNHTDMNSSKALHSPHRSGSIPRQSSPLSSRTPDQKLDFVKAAGRSPAVKKAASKKSKDAASQSKEPIYSPRSPPTDEEWNEKPKETEAPAKERELFSPRSPPSIVTDVAGQDLSKSQDKSKSKGRAVPPPSLSRSIRGETPGPESPGSSSPEASRYTGTDPRLARTARAANAVLQAQKPTTEAPQQSFHTATASLAAASPRARPVGTLKIPTTTLRNSPQASSSFESHGFPNPTVVPHIRVFSAAGWPTPGNAGRDDDQSEDKKAAWFIDFDRFKYGSQDEPDERGWHGAGSGYLELAISEHE